MKAEQIKIGGKYIAKVSGRLTTVQVTSIDSCTIRNRQRSMYCVTNLATGRKIVFRSAAKFRCEAASEFDKLRPAQRSNLPVDRSPGPKSVSDLFRF